MISKQQKTFLSFDKFQFIKVQLNYYQNNGHTTPQALATLKSSVADLAVVTTPISTKGSLR
ncbi:hypothetical protein [Ruminococcus sp.]|mgnify:FL=1|uniref:hypothetical protein n=1 Tax=Ruminococcus sp. TaxID=41978 RepID=UPI003AB295C0